MDPDMVMVLDMVMVQDMVMVVTPLMVMVLMDPDMVMVVTPLMAMHQLLRPRQHNLQQPNRLHPDWNTGG
jgi:hypothetical protein